MPNRQRMYQRQVVPTRQSQAQAVLRTRSQVPNVYRFFARPQGADQPLAVPPVLSRQNDNEQQAAINAAVQRQLESSLVHPPLHAHKLAAPRLQPLDTPTPCIITASVQDSVSLSPQSKDCCADAPTPISLSLPAYRLLPARMFKMFLCLPPLKSLMQRQPLEHQHSITSAHHYPNAKQFRVCSRSMKSLIP